VIDVSPTAQSNEGSETYTLLESWDAEGTGIYGNLFERLQGLRPRRVFIDSMSMLRHLTYDNFQFRKQVLSLLQYLIDGGATVVFTAEEGVHAADEDLQFLCDGIIKLEKQASGRTLSVNKFRGSGFAEGLHNYRIDPAGVTVYPRLQPSNQSTPFKKEFISAGLKELDQLAGGGLSRGTVTIISGPTGVGKTSVGVQFMKEAASRGERSVIYAFEENVSTFQHRCDSINIPVSKMINQGTLHVEAVEPLWHNPDEFANRVRREVEEHQASIVMLDSLSGYRQSIRGDDLVERMHALCRYLVNMGVTVLLVNETEAIASDQLKVTEQGLSYLSDTVILMRYMEIDGELQKAIGILKKRTGDFEKNLRWFDITKDGISVGEPIRGYRGVLHGVPEASRE